MLNRIPAPLRFLTDAFVDVTSRVALAQRLIEAQLLQFEKALVGIYAISGEIAALARPPPSHEPRDHQTHQESP